MKTPIRSLWLLAGAVLLATPQTAVAGPNCTCRYAGVKYELGQHVCIRGKLARCEMNLNNTAWKTVAEDCPQALNLDQTPRRTVAGLSTAVTVPSGE